MFFLETMWLLTEMTSMPGECSRRGLETPRNIGKQWVMKGELRISVSKLGYMTGCNRSITDL